MNTIITIFRLLLLVLIGILTESTQLNKSTKIQASNMICYHWFEIWQQGISSGDDVRRASSFILTVIYNYPTVNVTSHVDF